MFAHPPAIIPRSATPPAVWPRPEVPHIIQQHPQPHTIRPPDSTKARPTIKPDGLFLLHDGTGHRPAETIGKNHTARPPPALPAASIFRRGDQPQIRQGENHQHDHSPAPNKSGPALEADHRPRREQQPPRPRSDRPQISQPEPPRPHRRASEARHSVRHTARHFFKSKAQIRHILAVSHPL